MARAVSLGWYGNNEAKRQTFRAVTNVVTFWCRQKNKQIASADEDFYSENDTTELGEMGPGTETAFLRLTMRFMKAYDYD